MEQETLYPVLCRIAEALERIAPQDTLPMPDFHKHAAFLWSPEKKQLIPVPKVQHVELSLLHGIDHVAHILLQNTLQFTQGFPANNALLWGARGTGKSSLVKAVHAEVTRKHGGKLVLIEIYRDDIASLPQLLEVLRGVPQRFILFCDDLSFDTDDAAYKSLKAVLDGGIAGRPENVLFYATSNRRHLMPRQMKENEEGSAIHPGEAVEEKVSLSDRFGLWLGFHSCSQDTYLAIVRHYAEAFGLYMAQTQLEREANEWSITRGSRSGRVAFQFICDLAGRLGKTIVY